MSELLHIPSNKLFIVPLGVETDDFLPDPQSPSANRGNSKDIHLGYLARLAPEKGLHQLVDAFIALRKTGNWNRLKLHVAGWAGPQHAPYLKEQQAKLKAAGLENQYSILGSVSRRQKIDFLNSLDLFCVPTTYADPKGIYLLEAVACGLPYVMPDHGAFPELHRRITEHSPQSNGALYAHASPDDLRDRLEKTLLGLGPKSQAAPSLISEIDIATHAKRLLLTLQGKPSNP